MKSLVPILFLLISINLSSDTYAWSFSQNPQKRLFKYIKKKRADSLNDLLSSHSHLLLLRHPHKDISPVLYALEKKSPQALKVLLEHGGYSNLKSDYLSIWESPFKNQDWKSLDILLTFFDDLPSGSQVLRQQELVIFQKAWHHLSTNSQIQIEEIFGYEDVGTALRSNNEDLILEQIDSGHYLKFHEYLKKIDSSMLQWSIEHSYVELARTAIYRGSSLNKEVNGLSPLQCALLSKEDDIAVLLILNGANTHQGVRIGKRTISLLHLAIDQKSYRVAKALISKGANLDQKNAEGLSVHQRIKDEKIYVLAAYLIHKKVISRLQSILYNQLPYLNLESYTLPSSKVHFYKLFDGIEKLKDENNPNTEADDFCPICFEPFQNAGTHCCMNEECKFGDHRFKVCNNCLKESLKVQIKDYSYPLHCDHCGVEQVFTKEDLFKLGLQEYTEEIELQTHLAYFKSMFPTAKNCSTPNCANLIRETDCDSQGHYQCVCGASYCFKCGENHRGINCEAHATNKKFLAQNPLGRAMHDPASDLRPCPYCYKPYMKDDKCNYVICPNCKNKWDFIKGKWKYGNDHNRRTDGFNENWKKGKRTYRIPGDINPKTGKPYTAYTEGVYD